MKHCTGDRSTFSLTPRLEFLATVIALFSLGCNGENDSNGLFDFDVSNEFVTQGSDVSYGITRAYLDTEFQWTSVHMNLNDGVVGDSLVTSCGNWSYEVNPNSTVEIWFPDAFVDDGIYHFSDQGDDNDFQILIKRDLSFGPTFSGSFQLTENSLQQQVVMARGFTEFDTDQPFEVTQATIQILNIRSEESTIRFVLELANEYCITGSFQGAFEPFRRIEIEGDCD